MFVRALSLSYCFLVVEVVAVDADCVAPGACITLYGMYAFGLDVYLFMCVYVSIRYAYVGC